jgi:hypothetical protein
LISVFDFWIFQNKPGMKTIAIIAATLAALSTAGTAAETQTFLGCEMVKAENGGYFFKADPSCVYAGLGADATSPIGAEGAPGK